MLRKNKKYVTLSLNLGKNKKDKSVQTIKETKMEIKEIKEQLNECNKQLKELWRSL